VGWFKAGDPREVVGIEHLAHLGIREERPVARWSACQTARRVWFLGNLLPVRSSRSASALSEYQNTYPSESGPYRRYAMSSVQRYSRSAAGTRGSPQGRPSVCNGQLDGDHG
jgi:hypothetical protein